MKLPSAEAAEVGSDKIVRYLLNEGHPNGGGKAKFFRGHGFQPDRAEEFALALRQIAIESEVAIAITTEHGRKYIIDGRITAPDGETPFIRTVWIVDVGGNRPRLVTAFPKSWSPS